VDARVFRELSVQARYLFTHVGIGKRNQTPSCSRRTPSFRHSLWRTCRRCRAAHQSRLRPAHDRQAADPGALRLAWPFIRCFTERVFAEDRTAVEAEQRVWDEQGQDWNHEVSPLILDVRDVLRTNVVPIHLESALYGAAASCGSVRLASTTPHAEPVEAR
jgi:hypothetical protein